MKRARPHGAPFFVPVTVQSDSDLYNIQTQGMRGQSMRYWWGIVVSAMAASGCAYQPQRTAISTPSSERLQMQRRSAHVGPEDVGFLGGLFALHALGVGEPAVRDEPVDRLRYGGRFRDFGRTDASTVELHPRPPHVEDPQSPATVPLVLKLPPGMQ